jgi:hypothetical protein
VTLPVAMALLAVSLALNVAAAGAIFLKRFRHEAALKAACRSCPFVVGRHEAARQLTETPPPLLRRALIELPVRA